MDQKNFEIELKDKTKIKFFLEKNSQIFSEFFKIFFIENILFIKISKLKNENFLIECKFNLNFNFANFLNIIHGGAIAILFENLSNFFLFYITNNNYKTIDMNLTYKSPLKIDKIYNLKMEIEKIKFKSVFINCLIYDEKQNKYTTSIIIKEIIPKLKL